MGYGIAFSPLVPQEFLWVAVAVAVVVIAALLLVARTRGALLRTLALALVVLALANPSLTREDREPLTSVAVVVVDKSPSQNVRRPRGADRSGARRADRPAGAHSRTRSAHRRSRRSRRRDRRHAAVLRADAALADVPPDRVAGAIMITDGRVHDVPPDAATLGFTAPVHALITGQANERDRRVALVTAPRFGIVGQPQSVAFRVEDHGVPRGPAQVTVRRDGESHRPAHRAHRRERARADPDPACRTEHRRDRRPRRSRAN